MMLAVFLGVLIVGIMIGIPVAYSLLLSALAMMFMQGVFELGFIDVSNLLAQPLINGVNSFPLLAIPFFMFAGEVMTVGGLSQRIVRLAMSFVGHRRGGLGYVAILTSIVLAGLSGSAVADAAALISILFPMMRQANYPEHFSAGLLGAGGIIAPIIPPSLPLILVGVSGNISIAKLFIGGIAPGIMMGMSLMAMWWFLMRRRNIAITEKASAKERMKTLYDGIWALCLPFIIIFGIRGGFFTPTEAAVVAAVYALFVSSVIYKELTLKALYGVLVRSGRSAGMVMFLVGCAMVASNMITLARLPQEVASLLGPLVDNPRLLMAAIMILVLLIGCVMDLSPTVLILVPLLMPVVKQAGIDPVYFGLMFTICCCIGLLTPPVGTVLNVVCGIGKVRMDTAVKGLAPFIGVYIVLMVLFVLFPQLITAPLNFMYK